VRFYYAARARSNSCAASDSGARDASGQAGPNDVDELSAQMGVPSLRVKAALPSASR